MTKPSPKTVWITRTLPGAIESAKAFERAGYKTVIAPLLDVELLPLETDIPENAVLIFTSQNGVRAFCISEAHRRFSVITVGDATAALAKEMGFRDVISAGGTSDDIAPLIANAHDKNALYLHLSGQHVRGSVSEDLLAMGLKAERWICYRSAPVTEMPDIDVTQIDIAVFFSPLAAQTLAGLSPNTAHITALSISPATDEALGASAFSERCRSPAPTLESMIAALKGTG